MRYFLDTSAWIEYFEGGDAGKQVSDIINKEDSEIYTSVISVAEIVTKFKRKKKDVEAVCKAILTNSIISEISFDISKEAGILHTATREKISSFGLIDSLILSSSKSLNSVLVTKDNHFKSFKNIIIIS